ncbi:unnamed protein product [Notodromas monacha]|uniref:Superoxide dismutase copper/zinc binding domain-containing protein n=1 Tax=Notodromas monacha TaxID=399045 RepID=A0A7R9BJC6_9CRUS|nr:unnamed protein product [Notodromas monacha]CAG0915215.1 unnamed protein product [Notodromas monacha]
MRIVLTLFYSIIPVLLISSWCDAQLRFLARISRGGIKGSVMFEQERAGADVKITSDLSQSSGTTIVESLDWGIQENPVDYTIQDPCTSLGEEKWVDFTKHTSGKSVFDAKEFFISPSADPKIELLGMTNTIWGRSVRIHGKSTDACGTIVYHSFLENAVLAEAIPVFRSWRATFRVAVGGTAVFRSIDFTPLGFRNSYVLVATEMYSLAGGTKSLNWALQTSDSWDSTTQGFLFIGAIMLDLEVVVKLIIYYVDPAATENEMELCRNSQWFDPDAKGASCGSHPTETCAVGDLTSQLGKAHVGAVPVPRSLRQFATVRLTGKHLESPNLYLALKDGDNLISCAKLFDLTPLTGIAYFNAHGVFGNFTLLQTSPFEATEITINLQGLKKIANMYHVHEFPVPPQIVPGTNACMGTGAHFNPYKVDFSSSPKTGLGTEDMYELGDLSGKHSGLMDLEETQTSMWDSTLPLFGRNSVLGRSIVIHKANDKSRFVCATIEDTRPLLKAQAIFHYPFTGVVMFAQAHGDPSGGTTVFVEDLVYVDGTQTNSSHHLWHIHENQPSSFKDSIASDSRCASTKGHYNPTKANPKGANYEFCPLISEYCEEGDLATRHQNLSIAGSKADRGKTRIFFHDDFLPLFGIHSIINRSIVVHGLDEKPRGNRVGCAKILLNEGRKVSTLEWSTDDVNKKIISGSIKFSQSCPYSRTIVEVDLQHLLSEAGGYHVHVLKGALENSYPSLTTGPHWNPLEVSATIATSRPKATPSFSGFATIDMYEVGDLSGKFGVLDGLPAQQATYKDANTPLYGNTSITGRAIVVHKVENGTRWSSADLQLYENGGEARDVIVSFHQEECQVYGFIKMRQVRYRTGVESDTTIEIDIKYKGDSGKKVTKGHTWSVFKERVDDTGTHCSTPKNRWNPFMPVLSPPIEEVVYKKQCGLDLPRGCESGDMTSKDGPLTLGPGKRDIMNDPNFSLFLEGDDVVGKALILYGEGGSNIPLACANIEKNWEIGKVVGVQSTPSFMSIEFINTVRDIIGVPPWMLYLDMSAERTQGDCLTLRVIFTGK